MAQQHYSVADRMSDSANRYCDRNLGFMLPSSNFYYCIHLSSVKIYVVWTSDLYMRLNVAVTITVLNKLYWGILWNVNAVPREPHDESGCFTQRWGRWSRAHTVYKSGTGWHRLEKNQSVIMGRVILLICLYSAKEKSDNTEQLRLVETSQEG